jgi:predicted amidophosphoribosyltransferase
MNAGYNFGFFFVPLLLGAMGAFFTLIGIVMLAVLRSAQPLFCPGCGSRVKTGEGFCPECAAPLQSSEDSQIPPAKLAA